MALLDGIEAYTTGPDAWKVAESQAGRSPPSRALCGLKIAPLSVPRLD